MTTVVDPLGSPSVIYNRSGTAIVSVDGGTTSGPAGNAIGNEGNPIPRFSQTTIVMAVTSRTILSPISSVLNVVFRLPDDAEIGDVVEVYASPDSTWGNPVVFSNVGEAIGSLAASTGTNTGVGLSIGTSSGISFRKVSSTQWMPLGSQA